MREYRNAVEPLENRRLLSVDTTLVGSVPGSMRDVEVQGDRAYLLQGDTLVVLDVSAATPVALSSVELGQAGRGLDVQDHFAYVIGERYFQIIDISDSSSPRLVGSVDDVAYNVTVNGQYAYLPTYNNRMDIFDISVPSDPGKVKEYYDWSTMTDIQFSGSYGYLVTLDGMDVLSMADPANPTSIAAVPIDGLSQIALDGTTAYATSWNHELEVIDISTPQNPAVIATLATDSVSAIGVLNGRAILSGGDRLDLINVQNPATPVRIRRVLAEGYGWNMAISGNRAYVPLTRSGLAVFDLSSFTTAPLIGQWGKDHRSRVPR